MDNTWLIEYHKCVVDVAREEQRKREGRGMELKDTINWMQSDDYKERFEAEYWQTKIRYDKLHKMTIKYEAGTLGFEPKCSLDLLNEQKHYMGLYLHAMEVRADIEGIRL